MKKMKTKRLLAVLLTLAMVLGMTMTAFAGPTGGGDGNENDINLTDAGDDNQHSSEGKDNTTGNNNTNGSVTEGIESGSTTNDAIIKGVYPETPNPATVKAYQIVTYNSNGFYEVVPALKNWIPTSGTAIELSSNVVQDLYYNHLEVVQTGTSVDFTRAANGDYVYPNLGLGSWLVVVTSSSGNYLYNPAIISVSQTPNGKDYGVLNLDTSTWLGEEGVYLKRDEPKIEKDAESADGHDTNVVGTQYGDILKFTITADIPAYTASKTGIIYKITDTMKGLSYVVDETHPVAVSVGGVTVSGSSLLNAGGTGAEYAFDKVFEKINDAANISKQNSFCVDGFGDAFLTANSNGKIVITYYAKVTSTELINVDFLNNKAELDYSNNHGTDTGHKDTNTKHYTFGIDVAASGSAITQNKTGEFIKINDQGGVEYTETLGDVITTGGAIALSGAAFQLRIGSSAADAPLFTDKTGKNTFETDSTGRLQIVGLDDNVEYYLVEVKAPEGYSLNETPIKVLVEATYEEDPNTGKKDKLTGYTIWMGDQQADDGSGNKMAQGFTHYKYDIETGETTFINTEDTPSNPFGFKNTKLSGLPSTGGIGTTIFTIAGCLIMILAAALFFASRRKTSKK